MKKNLILLVILGAVAAALGYFYFNRSDKSFADSFADFAIQDTAAVTRFTITDSEGKQINVKRDGLKWILNDTLEARPELATLVLRAAHDALIRTPVAKNSRETIIKRLAAVHKMVQFYTDGSSEPIKTWYVGDPTPDHFGTYVLLELPEKGKSPDPYVLELPWHKGYLTPMFMADYNEWMQTPVFIYPNLEFTKVTVMNYEVPANSFSIEKSSDRFAVKSIQSNAYLPNLDSLFVKDYVENYKSVYYEIRDKYLSKFETDSMINSRPIYQIQVTENDGKINQIKIYKKKGGQRAMDPDVLPSEFDRDRYYALLNDKQVVLIQKYAFDKLLINLQDFMKQNRKVQNPK